MSNSGGFLTTHVLDTARGCPASGLAVDLFRLTGNSRELVATATTNADGRTDSPILGIEDFRVGIYELVFHAGDYMRSQSDMKDEELFLDEVPIRFTMNKADAHYHVPLLLSPFGYATYRGS